jgi:hypothetical protein
MRLRRPKHTRAAALLGGLAAVAVVIALMSAADAAKPAVGWLKAQPVSKKQPRRGIAVVGVARGKLIRIQYRGGCRGLGLGSKGKRKRRFATVVRRNRVRCLRPLPSRRWVKAEVCDGSRCNSRRVRILPFRDADGDGRGNLFERFVRRQPWRPARPAGAATPPPVGAPGAPAETPLAPFAQLGCVVGAVDVDSEDALLDEVEDGNDVCVSAAIVNVELEDLGDLSGVTISSRDASAAIGTMQVEQSSGLTIQGARLRSLTIRRANGTVVRSNMIGGTPSARVEDQLIFMPDASSDVTIESNDIGWTIADNSGNTGYGCRCYGELDRLRFVGNKVHDLAADGFQGVSGSDVLIDRNEIGPVGANPSSSEHSDNIQITGNGPGLRITNNWIHHQGYYDGTPGDNAGSTYIHGGSNGSLLYENNLVQTNLGRTEICGLGTGGSSRSNITIRRNTWVDGGRNFTGFPGFEWDCTSGSNNTIERNIAVDPDGGFAGSKSAATFADNIWGRESAVTLDPQGNCTSANCNPPGAEPIGYRKPPTAHW